MSESIVAQPPQPSLAALAAADRLYTSIDAINAEAMQLWKHRGSRADDAEPVKLWELSVAREIDVAFAEQTEKCAEAIRILHVLLKLNAIAHPKLIERLKLWLARHDERSTPNDGESDGSKRNE